MLDFKPERAVNESVAITEPIAPAETETASLTNPNLLKIVAALIAIPVVIFVAINVYFVANGLLFGQPVLDYSQDPSVTGDLSLTHVETMTVEEYQNRTPSN